jgi:Tol biopolymer transport system component
VPRSSSRLAWALVTVLAAALASAVALPYFRGAADAPELRVEIGTPATADPTAFAIAPNGRSLVFVASGDGQPRLWLRRLDGSNAQPLPGTEEARHPFWSPDGRSVGFFKAGTLMRTEISGGMPQLITDASPGLGGAWGPDGSILFAPTFGSPLYRVPAEGGEAVALSELESPGQFSHRFPKFLPGGRQFLFYVLGTEEASGIYLGSLDDPKRMRRVTAADAAGAYVAPGWLLFVRQGALVARRFDPSTGELSGNAVQLAEAVRASDESLGAISASTTGMVAYRSGGETPTRLTWFDRSGKALDAVGGPDVTRLIDPELSPDGTRVAGTRTVQGNTDIWIVDRLRPIRLTADPAIDRFPIWSPDGARLLFGSTRTGPSDLYVKPSDGSSGEQLILPSPQVKNPNDWSPDGRFLLYFEIRERISPDLWALPLDETRKPFALADSPFPEVWGRFSPDGRWVAYQSNESGRWEIYVRPFPAPGGVWPISTSGGISPRWAPSGKELYYIAPDGTLMAVAITVTGATLDAGAPKALFQVRILGGGSNFVGRRQQYDVARDGRFLINVITDETSPSPITLVLNWRPEER